MKTEVRYGKRIKEARLARGWTQEHLAEIADVAPRTVARIEKEEVRGSESLMAIAAAFEVELRELATVVRIAEAKPLRSLLIRQPEDLQIAFSRASHCGLYRSLLLPIRDDYRERTEELLEMIFCDLQYLSPDESDMVRSWVGAAKEPLTELHEMGLQIFTVQDNREGFIGEPGHKQLFESWTTGYYLLVMVGSCFSTGNGIHRFHDRCPVSVQALHDWLRQEQDGTDVRMYMFANSLMVFPMDKEEPKYCQVCFPEGPNGDGLIEDYLKRSTELSSEKIRELIAQFGAIGEASA